MTTTIELSAPAVGRPTIRPIRTGAVLAILLTAQLMAILDANVVNVAGATIQADLHTGGAGLQLVIGGYTIAYAVLLITGARVGGIVGPRRTFLAGLAIFTAASLACGLAPGTWWLVAFRFVQGAAAAFLIPQVFSLIQRHFIGPARIRALGRFAAVVASGVTLGQVLGGVLVDADLFGTGWRPVFWINVPIGFGLLFAGARLLPADVALDRRRLDPAGLVGLIAAVLALVLPVMFGHQEGWPTWTWISLAAAVVLFGGFMVTQRLAAEPLMPARVVRAPGMLPALAAIFLMMLSFAGYLFAVALHMQVAEHFSPLRAGLTFAPMAIAFGVASLNWRRIPARWHGAMVPLGLTVVAAGTVATALVLRHDPAPGALFLALLVPTGIGSGIAFSPLMNRALAGVAPADAPDASGLVTTSVQLAQVIGLALIGSLYLALVAAGHAGSTAVSRTLIVDGAVAALAALVALGTTIRTNQQRS
ncbi:MAG TPA: MFS transporter [Micromonosporaceae bacterium]|jgi:MFS family permease